MKKKLIINTIIFILVFVIDFILYFKKVEDIKNVIIQKEIKQNPVEEIKEIKKEGDSANEQKPIYIKFDIPFTSQAPNGNWKDQRQENGCEEAAALMAMYWVNDKNIDKNTIEKEITDIADYEQEKYNNYIDTSSEDTVIRIFNNYFNYYNVEAKYNISIEDIIKELKAGNLVLVPTNGQKLNNPFYTAPGPTHHELVITGYDEKSDEFITNDSGTKRGENYKYKTDILYNSIYDYKTGNNEPVDEIIKAMIVVKK